MPQNVAVVWHTGKGDFAQAVASADVHLKQRLINQCLIPTALEPRAVLAQYTPATQELVLFTSTQAPHLIRRLLAETLNIPEHKLRVIAPDVGGGFGSKLHFYAEEALCAFLARELGRPVKWCETRSENFLATTHGRNPRAVAPGRPGECGPSTLRRDRAPSVARAFPRPVSRLSRSFRFLGLRRLPRAKLSVVE